MNVAAGSDRTSVVIHEYGVVEGVQLHRGVMNALRNYRVKVPDEDGRPVKKSPLSISPSAMPGHYTLRANSIVGSFAVPGADINILPKAGVGRTAEMLAYGAGLSTWQMDWSRFEQTSTFSQALAPMYLRELGHLVGSGLVEEYVSFSERGASPRGRIDFDLLARQGLPLPADYTFDELTIDTPHNRLLRRALHEVTDLPGVTSGVHAAARELLGSFVDVSFQEHPQRFQDGYLEPRTLHYRTSLLLASLLIERLGLEALPGNRMAQGLLFDMNKVFEAFVVALVRRAAGGSLDVDAQGVNHRLYLDKAQTLRLRPDFSLWSLSRCALVGDAKYKIMSEKKRARRSDIYQIISYAAACRCDVALLVYTGATDHEVIEIGASSLTVTALPLDLSLSIRELESMMRNAIERLVTAAVAA